MDLHYSTADNAFRAEVWAWLDANLPDDLKARMPNHRRMRKADYMRWRTMTETTPGDTDHPLCDVCHSHRSGVGS